MQFRQTLFMNGDALRPRESDTGGNPFVLARI